MNISSKDFGLRRSYWEIRVGSLVLNLYLWGLVTFVWSPYFWHISGTWPTFSWMMDFTCIQYFVGWMMLMSLYICAVCWISSFPFRSWWPEFRMNTSKRFFWQAFVMIWWRKLSKRIAITIIYIYIYIYLYITTKWCWGCMILLVVELELQGSYSWYFSFWHRFWCFYSWLHQNW